MPCNLILNEKTLASAQFAFETTQPPVRFTLSGLTFSSAQIDGHTLSGYMLVSHHKKPIAIFGQSPDRNEFLTAAALKKFYENYHIKRIYCLDQRRNQCLAEELNHKITLPCNDDAELEWQNVHRFERTLNIDIYNAYHGVRFDLADKFMINSYRFSPPEIDTLHNALAQLKPTSLGNAQLPNNTNIAELKRTQYYTHTEKDYYGKFEEASAQKFTHQLRFYPSPVELQAFMHSMNEAQHANETPIIYCAGGVGRTALYLSFWIKESCQCSLVTAMQVVNKAYFTKNMQEVKSFLEYMKFTLSPIHRKTLTHYIQSTSHFWQSQVITQAKNNIAQALLEERYINHTVLRHYANQIQHVNTTHQKPPENGRLYNLLQSIAADLGLTPQELRPQGDLTSLT